MRLFLSFLVALVTVSARADVLISEFMASNTKTLADDYGNFEDWIEVANTGPGTVNLYGWAMTDTTNNMDKWVFPATNLVAGSHLVVFASGRDRRTVGQTLHTNFKLDAAGEYLALVRPDGSVATQFRPAFPQQAGDVAYGYGVDYLSLTVIHGNSTGRLRVPSNGVLGETWRTNTFNDSGWTLMTNGVGYTTEVGFVADVLADAPLGFWRLGESSTSVASPNLGSVANANLAYTANMQVGMPGPQAPAFVGFGLTNTCARLNGSNSRAEVPYRAALNPAGSFSVELWVRPTVNTGGFQCPMSSINFTTSSRAGYLFYQNAATSWEFRVGNTNSANYLATASGGTPVLGVWHHLVGVYDGSSLTLYVNGVAVGSAALGGAFSPNTSQVLRIGATGSGTGTNPFNGDVDEVAVFGRVLTAAEISQRYAAGTTSSFGYASAIRTDVRTAMSGVNSSAYIRLPFVLTNIPALNSATLRMRCDDGFHAFLNGVPMAQTNAPGELVWNSTATASRTSSNAVSWQGFNVNPALSALRMGTNVLALHGLNVSSGDSDFLLSAELELASSGGYLTQQRYFVLPTPGSINTAGSSNLGPIMVQADHFPPFPGTNDSLTITSRVTEAFGPITGVALNWRVMFGNTNATPMFDDGLHGDGIAGDGVYGATISRTNYTAGQMVRWFLTATDSLSRTSRWPLFASPTNSAEYLGTVIQANYVTSSLPVMHLFAPASVLQPGPTTSQTGADSQTGGRVSAWFDGEFYDNIHMELRGNSTANYNKKSHRLEFNSEHKFRHASGGPRIRKTSFTADYPDTTYMRQGLAFWLLGLSGAPGPFYEPYRLQLNGAFYQLANHNDVHGEELLERLGYDPNGALYNAAGTIVPGGFSTGGFDKKTRTWEGNSDYVALANAVSESLSLGQRLTNLFDRLDLPQVISYMVVARFTHENDDVWANMSLYHDNDGDDLWRIIPFDMNLSFGAAYVDSGVLVGIQSTNDSVKSHPLYGSSQTIWNDTGNWNRLYDAIFQVPETREMFLRRLRTFLDAWVKPPGTPVDQLPIEAKVLAWRDLILAEADRDRAWWGWAPDGGQNNLYPDLYITTGVQELLDNFLAVRRGHFYGKHSVTNTALPIGINKASNAGIPLAQPTNAMVSIVGWDYNPVSGNQDEEYIVLTNANNYAIDISDWKLAGGISHRLQKGTVIPAGSALYLAPDSRVFRNRAIPPRGGMGLFVQGGYSGHLNAWGESLTLTDESGRLVSSNSFVGNPSPAQRYLRVTEIMYNPAPEPAVTNDAQLFEYIELRNVSSNTTLNLAGCRFTNGISFNFTGSAVTTLGPGQRVVVVRDLTAFTAKYGGSPLVAGQFAGSLDSNGETLRLEDAVGEKILEFAYNNTWYPITDGHGFSLVIVNDQAHWSTWGDRASWRPAGTLGGGPGFVDPAPPTFAPVLVTEVLPHTDLPQVDSIELHNPTGSNVLIGGWFLTDDFYAPKKYRITGGTSIVAGGHLVLNANQFNTGSNAFLLSEHGDSAYLFSADASENLTGYYQGWDFKASPNGVSFGRYVNSQTNSFFVLQSENTLGGSNALPKVGPVVVSEIQYHPPDLTNGADNDLDEYIELQNLTGTNVPLFCIFTNEPGYGAAALTNTWHLRNGVDFDFPTNITLAPGNRLLVVGFSPTNTAQLGAFRARYGVAAGIPIYGPWSGKLDNSGEQIELKRPDVPETSGGVFVPYIKVEEIDYRHGVPWPTNADGLGNSLQRRVNSAFANDPTNWFAGVPTPGTPNTANELPSVSMVSPAQGAKVGRLPGIELTAQAVDSDGSIAEVSFFDGGTLVARVTTPPWTYLWTNAPFGFRSLRARAADNQEGVTESAVVSITVTSQPPLLTLVAPLPGTNVVLGLPVELAATASDPDSSVVAVDFFLNGILLGTVPAPTFTLSWTPALSGAQVISAVARDEGGGTSPPSAVTVFVQNRVVNPILVPLRGPWRFLDNGIDQGIGWMQPGVGVSGWSSGLGLFGFGGSGLAFSTPLGFGADPNNKFPTYYFRKDFTVSGLVGMTNLMLEFQRDDGVAFYLNGQPLHRDNLPAGDLAYSQLATNCSDDGTLLLSVLLPTNHLVIGTNVLAAEVHQSSVSSSDLAFDARLTMLGQVVSPGIVTQPQGISRQAGQPASFSVLAVGTEPLAYQWRRNGVPIPGGTAAVLSLAAVTAGDAGDYSVWVNNPAGSIESGVATLTVLPGNPDSDNDGMLDVWEQANGLVVGINDANLDPDGDRMSNIKEFHSGTNPQDPLSVLKLTPLGLSNGNVLIQFNAQSNLSYTIQQAGRLGDGTWQAWMQISPAPSNRVITATNAAPLATNRFYRVVTPQLP